MDKDFNCGDRKYSFGMLPATEALKVEVAIARVIGEPLFKAFLGVSDGDIQTDGKVDKEKLASEMMKSAGVVIGLLTSKMDADDLLETMERVFKFVNVDGRRISSLDAEFTGRNRELWQVFIEALRFNFRDFFSADLFASIPVGKRK